MNCILYLFITEFTFYIYLFFFSKKLCCLSVVVAAASETAAIVNSKWQIEVNIGTC